MSAGIRAGDFFPIKRAAACVLLCASNAIAANPVAASANELRGVRAFTLSVEPLDEHAIKCSISRQAIEASARAALQKSKVALRPPESPNPNSFLYYNVNVISLQRGQCVYSFSLSVRLIGELKMGARMNPGAYTAWHKEGLRSTAGGNAANTMSYDIGDLTKAFIAAWSEVNP